MRNEHFVFVRAQPFAQQREDSNPREAVGFGALQPLFPDLGWEFLFATGKQEDGDVITSGGKDERTAAEQLGGS